MKAKKKRNKFKRGARVICFKSTADTAVGVTGVVKRYDNYPSSQRMVVIRRDDGKGWFDDRDNDIGWSVPERDLKLDKEYQLFEMDA